MKRGKKASDPVDTGFVLHLIGREGDASFLNQS